MRRYAVAYGLWLAGVLSAAAVAYYYYRRVMALGYDELEARGVIPHPRSAPPRQAPPVADTAEPAAPDEG